MEAYRDRWVTCDDDEIRIRAYFFPWGTKRIPYGSIRDLRRVAMDVLHGRGRIWGTGNFGYWASLDPKRPSKSIAFILDIGRHVRPFLTPDDPDAFERAVRGHVSIGQPGPTEDPPLIWPVAKFLAGRRRSRPRQVAHRGHRAPGAMREANVSTPEWWLGSRVQRASRGETAPRGRRRTRSSPTAS